MDSFEKPRSIYLGIEESRLISDRVASLVGDCSRMGTCTCMYKYICGELRGYASSAWRFLTSWNADGGKSCQAYSAILNRQRPLQLQWNSRMMRYILVILVDGIMLAPSSNLVIARCNGSGRISDLQALSFLSELHYRGEIGQTVYDM